MPHRHLPHDDAYRDFIACWNEGRYFDAHEALEALWVRTRDAGQQGLIQLAVALHHATRGNLRGARTMIGRALPRLRDLAAVAGPIDREEAAAFAERLRAALDDDTISAAIAARPRFSSE